MITSLRIRGFKSLMDESIELGNINVFIGANGSGKSNILEAIGLLSAAASSKVDDEALLRRGVRPGLPMLYKSSFDNIRTPNEISFEAKSAENNIFYKVCLYNPIKKPNKSWKYQSEYMSIGSKVLFSDGLRTWKNRDIGLAATSLLESEPDSPEVEFLNQLQEYAIYTPNTVTLRGLLPDPIKGAVGLQGGGLAEALEEIINHRKDAKYLDEALDLLEWVSDLQISQIASLLLSPSVPRQKKILIFEDRFMGRGRNKLTAYDASEGALYVLFALVLAKSPHMSSMFAVDNFDQAINPRLSKKLIKKFCRWILKNHKFAQTFLTVHNPLTLDGLSINDDRVRLFAVDRDNRGFTNISRIIIDEKIRRISKEKGWPLSTLWVMGHLGGMPNV